MRLVVRFRLAWIGGLAVVMALGAVAQARDFEMGGDNQFPYSIMAPEPGTATHHRATRSHRPPPDMTAPDTTPLTRRSTEGKRLATRGTSGSVLPTPLPRTRLIPPEGSSTLTTPALPQQHGPTFVPSAPSLGAIPNLPHGSETFQDRASRCTFQQGLYGVPGTAGSQYMGACVQ